MSDFSKEILRSFILGIIIFLVHGFILYVAGNPWYGSNVLDFLWQNQLFTMCLYMANWYVFRLYFDKPKTLKWTSKRVLKGVILGIITSLTVVFILRLFLLTGFYGRSFQEFFESEKLSSYYPTLFISLISITIYYAFFYWKHSQENKVKQSKVIAGSASARFDALKNQLDPHFLFNSLNVLTSLIDENPKSAQKFTTSLSKVYRYVLEQKNKELVSLDEELNFARTYMSLLKMRFEDSIIFEIPDQASNPDLKVVPLSLQLLLENAVKHNMVTSNKPLHVKIYEDENHLVVQNNLQPKKILKKSSGVGLENIKQRYQLLTDKKLHINQRAEDFVVAIPMLTKQVSIMRTSNQNEANFRDDYLRARKRVEELKGFYYSVVSYFIVIPVLIYIWYRFTPFTFQWFWFPIIFWGLSNIIQAYRVFVDNGAFGAKWEQRKIEEYMRKEDRTNWK